VKFSPGRLVATPGALAYCEENVIDLLGLVARHLSGDWGELGAEDVVANEVALRNGARILSAYGPLYIITEADRSATTVLLKNEY
jgi:hypothetical protein